MQSQNENQNLPNCQTIGNLTQSILKNVQPSGSMSPSSTKSSETITQPAPQNLPAGMPPSSHGLATLKNSIRTETDPWKTNKALLQSLQSDLGSQLVIEEKLNKDWEVIGLYVTIKTNLSDDWRKAIVFFNNPSPRENIAISITRLRSMTAKRPDSEIDMELAMGAFIEELSTYPEDIVKFVCMEWARKNKWFPVLSALVEKCEELMIPRRALMRALS